MNNPQRRHGAQSSIAAALGLAQPARGLLVRNMALPTLLASTLTVGTSAAAAPQHVATATDEFAAEPIEQEPQSTSQIEDAERLAAEAFEHYGRRQYREAIALYERALEAAPAANIYYNLARIFDLGLRDRQNAAKYYRKYAEHPSAARQRADYARLRVEELSDAPPIEAPSAVQQELEASDSDNPARTFGTNPGLTLQSTAGDALQPIDSPSWSSTEIAAASFAGVGAASLLVATGYAVGAYSQRQTWQRECQGNDCTSQRGVDAATSALSRADRATVALATGGTLIALGSAIYWFTTDSTQESEMPVLRVAFSPAGPSAALSGSF